MPTGYLALLDVLGFSALIRGNDDETPLLSYLDCVRETLDATPGGGVDYVVFSDSIVLTAGNDASEAAFQRLAQQCSALFGNMLKRNIALRGAISFGSFFRQADKGGVFIAGKPVIDAYSFEQKQDWVGIMVTPSARRHLPDLEQKCEIGEVRNFAALPDIETRIGWCAFLQPAHIPFHPRHVLASEYFHGFAILPTSGKAEPTQLNADIEASIGALRWLKSLAPDPGAQTKYDHSIQWLQGFVGTWSAIQHWVDQAKPKTGPP